MVSPRLRLILLTQWHKNHLGPITSSLSFEPDFLDFIEVGTAYTTDIQVVGTGMDVTNIQAIADPYSLSDAPEDFAFTVNEDNLVHVSFTANGGFDFIVRVTYKDANNQTQTVENSYHAGPENEGGGSSTPLVFTATNPSQANVGQPYTFDSGVTGADEVDFTVRFPFGGLTQNVTTTPLVLASGLSIVKTSGNTFQISGTPTQGGFFGDFLVKATDPAHPTNTVGVTFYLGANGSVTPPPAPPVTINVTPTPLPSMDPVAAPTYAQDLHVGAVNGAVTSFSAISLPDGFTGTVVNSTTYHIEGPASYTPFTVQLLVQYVNQDGQGGSVTKTIPVNAVEEPQPITIQPTPPAVVYGELYDQLFTFVGPEGSTINFVSGNFLGGPGFDMPQDQDITNPQVDQLSVKFTASKPVTLALYVNYTLSDGSDGNWERRIVLREAGGIYFPFQAFFSGAHTGIPYAYDLVFGGAEDILFTVNGEATPTTTPFNGLLFTKTGPTTLHAEGIPDHQPQSYEEAAVPVTATSAADPSKSVQGDVILPAQETVPEVLPYTLQDFPIDQPFAGDFVISGDNITITNVVGTAAPEDQPEGYEAPSDFVGTYDSATQTLHVTFTPNTSSFQILLAIDYLNYKGDAKFFSTSVFARGNI